MLTSPQLRKLVRAHNILSKIVIPKGSSRDDIIKLIEKAGYRVDHNKKGIFPKVKRGKAISLTQAEQLTKPKPKTDLQKQKAQEKKAEKDAMKKKQDRDIRKKAIEEERARQKKPKTKPAKNPTTIGTRPKGVRVDTSASAKGTDMTGKELKKKSISISNGIDKMNSVKKAPKKEPKKETPNKLKKLISKIKSSTTRFYDTNLSKEKDITKWFNEWKYERRVLTDELKQYQKTNELKKEDLKEVEPINIKRTKKYKIRVGQIFQVIKEQNE